MKFIAIVFSLIFSISVSANQSAAPTFDQVVEVLKAEQPNSVAKALTVIKSKYPAYFEQYGLVARSMSIQGSSPEAPRVVLFDDEAKLVMTFNGQPGERGYDRIELMTFDDTKNLYDFREIKFMSDAGLEGSFEVSESGGVNGRCLNCHGQNTLPIWDSYPFWPDYYGSFVQPSYGSEILNGVQKRELEDFTNFVSSAKSHERYQVLPELSFASMNEMNSRIGRAFSKRVHDIALTELSALGEVKAKLQSVLDSFDAHDFLKLKEGGFALPIQPLGPAELAELDGLSQYHSSKIVRYARNYGLEKVALLDQLISSKAITEISAATGIAPENKLHLWTYTQAQPADLILIPRLKDALGQDILYLNAWSIVPGRRFIDFAHPDLLPYDSGIEKALADLL